MKAAVLREYKTPLKIEEVDLAAPLAGEVRIKVEATGVCHSDLLCRDGGFPVYQLPLIPGHEAAGTIVEVGEGVTKVKPGDHVIALWHPYCGTCWHCTHGEPFSCPGVSKRYGVKTDGTSRLSVGGEQLFHGMDAATFAEEAVLDENAVVKIDDDVPFEIAALIGCGVSTGVGAALNTADLKPGGRVAVIGCGGVGLSIVQGARIAGAEEIVAIDLNEAKLDAATKFGATSTIDANDLDPVGEVMRITEGVGVDHAFEAIGSHATQKQALRMIRKGGAVVLVGVVGLFDPLPVPTGLLTLMGQSIIGCFFGSVVPERDFPRFIEFWRKGKLDLEGLISDIGRLEDVNDAFDAMERGDVLRSVLKP